MSFQHYVVIFLVFSFFGWIIDTTYRSVAEGLYFPGTRHFFDPVYGLGALVLTLFFSYADFFVPFQILVAGLLLTLVELFAGIFIHKVLGYRLWDYYNNQWNFMGHIDLLHSSYWVLLALVYFMLGKVVPLYITKPLI